MNFNKKYWIALIGLLIVGVLSFFLLFHHLSQTRPQWQMHGVLMERDGTAQMQIEFTVHGKVSRQEGEPELEIGLSLPYTFPYSVSEDAAFSSVSLPQYEALPYHVLLGSCICLDQSDSVFCQSAFDTSKGFLLIDWNDGSGRYLVASTDSNTSPQEIFNYFQDFWGIHHQAPTDPPFSAPLTRILNRPAAHKSRLIISPS